MRSQDEALRFHHAITSLGLAFHRDLDDADFERFAADLDDVPIDAIEQACTHLRRHAKRFPTVAHIREQADLLPKASPRALMGHVPTTPNDPHYCNDCCDTGWTLGLWCEAGSCGHPRAHGPHSFTRPCPCRSRNPVYHERQQARRKFHTAVE